jgi:hypothetical protein
MSSRHLEFVADSAGVRHVPQEVRKARGSESLLPGVLSVAVVGGSPRVRHPVSRGNAHRRHFLAHRQTAGPLRPSSRVVAATGSSVWSEKSPALPRSCPPGHLRTAACLDSVRQCRATCRGSWSHLSPQRRFAARQQRSLRRICQRKCLPFVPGRGCNTVHRSWRHARSCG